MTLEERADEIADLIIPIGTQFTVRRAARDISLRYLREAVWDATLPLRTHIESLTDEIRVAGEYDE